MAEIPDRQPPPRYEEVVFQTADQQRHQYPNIQQSQQQRLYQHPEYQQQQAADSTATDSYSQNISTVNSPQTFSSVTTSSGSYSNPSPTAGQPSAPGILKLTTPYPESMSGLQVTTQSSMDAPAIIIHSALSSPGAESLEQISPLKEENRLDELSGQQNEGSNVSDSSKSNQNSDITVGTGTSNGYYGQNEQSIENQNIRDFHDVSETANNNITVGKNSSAILHETSDQQSAYNKPYLGNRKGIGVAEHKQKDGDTDVKVCEVQVDIHDARGPQIKARLQRDAGANIQFDGSNFKQKQSRYRDLVKNSGKSSSLDDSWAESTATDKLLGEEDNDMAPLVRPRGNTLDGSTSPTRFTKNCAVPTVPSPNLVPGTTKMSKSYNDLSARHRVTCQQENCYVPSVCQCGHGGANHHHHHHHHHHLGPGSPHSRYNKSSNNIHRDNHRCQRNHLLPESRGLQGSRGMRSVSENDVRMRSGTDEYTWKDGKVQMKNGGMTHGESVRYVWKDGHVEKITTDANNEETQVEILESSDNKTCSKINPIFICIFLIGVIAVVIILPVYFAS